MKQFQIQLKIEGKMDKLSGFNRLSLFSPQNFSERLH